MEAGAEAGAEAAADGIDVFADEDAWDVLEDIPNGSAAALILLEHHWAVPLRDAIARAGGFRISDGFISPLDLVEIGLVTAEEAARAARPRDRRRRPPPDPPTDHRSEERHVRIPQSRPAHRRAAPRGASRAGRAVAGVPQLRQGRGDEPRPGAASARAAAAPATRRSS